MKPKQRFFDLCRKLSNKSDHHSHKLGAVLVRKNKIVNVGFNKLSTHPRSTHPYKSLHAEMSALIGLNHHETKGCIMYVYRETQNGKPANSKPCPSCVLAMQQASVSTVFYSSNCTRGWDVMVLE